MPTSENGLGMEDYLEQFPNHQHFYQDENYNMPEWYDMPQKKAAPQPQNQQQPQQINPMVSQPQQGMTSLSNLL